MTDTEATERTGEDPTAATAGVGPAGADRGTVPATRRPPRWLMPVLAVVALAGVGGTLAFGLVWAHQQARLDDQQAARAVATRFLYDLTNFDARTVNADFSDIASLATGRFATQEKSLFTPQMRQALVSAHASTRGTLRYLALGSYSPSQASFYARVDQTFANDKSKTPQSDQLQAIVDLAKVGGRWKVAVVTTVGAAGVLGG